MVGKREIPAEWFIAGKFAMRQVSVSPSQFPRAKFLKIFTPVSSGFCSVKGAETRALYARKAPDSCGGIRGLRSLCPSSTRCSFVSEGQMKVWLRALFVGGGWAFGLLTIGLLVGLPQTLQTDRESVVIGAGSAILSALSFWAVTQLPKSPSWPIAIAGWIVGFFLLPGVVRVLVGIADLIFR